MRKGLFLFTVIVVALIGCNGGLDFFKSPKEPDVPDLVVVTGQTDVDYQSVRVLTSDRGIAVRVKVPDADGFRQLNKYEFVVTKTGIVFRRKVDIDHDSKGNETIMIHQYCCAPKGTDYEIRSVRLTVNKKLF